LSNEPPQLVAELINAPMKRWNSEKIASVSCLLMLRLSKEYHYAMGLYQIFGLGIMRREDNSQSGWFIGC
jgi:hypothetical protein